MAAAGELGRPSVKGVPVCPELARLGVGAAALVVMVPGLDFLEVVVGLLQIVWFLWFGIVTARRRATQSDQAVE